MRGRSAGLFLALCSAGALLALFGGAETGHAGPRAISPFTLTAAPSPAQLGQHVTFTMFFRNASKQTITHANSVGTATDGALFDSYTASQGTCAVSPTDPATVECDFGQLPKGTEVTATFRYTTPPPESGAQSVEYSTTLFINEGKGDPGSPSIFFPTPNPIEVALEPPNVDKVIDVFGVNGGSAATDPVTDTNLTSMSLTTPATGAFQLATIVDGPNDPTVCGSGTTSVLDATSIDAPGIFTPFLTAVLDLNKSEVKKPLQKVVGCHDGHTLPLGCPDVIPSFGCLASRVETENELGVNVYRLTMLGPSNGKWGGGF